MTWATPLADLRTFVADGPTDNLVKQRPVLGSKTGQNRTFFTFDDRLLASGNQALCGAPLRVFVDDAELAASGILITDQVRGEFQLMVVPSGSVTLTASYHYQQSVDAELNFDLQQAALQVNADQAANVQDGLQLAALHIAASMAYTRLATRWQQRKSDQFLLQDEPMRKEAEERIGFFRNEAERLMKGGIDIRRSYYDLRQDRGRAPAFGLLRRTPQPYTPKR